MTEETIAKAPSTMLPETHKILTKLRQIGRHIPWLAKPADTTDYPLIPFLRDKDGIQYAKTQTDDRDVPYYLRGRGDEFNFLAGKLISKPQPINLITAPPGFGKTALLHAVARYATEIGHTPIMLEPEDLANTATLVQKCRDAIMEAADAPAARSHTETQSQQIDSKIAIKAFVEIGTEVASAQTATEHHTEIGEVNLLKHMQAICSYGGVNRPILICIDEIQDLQDTIDSTPQCKSTIRANLRFLNSGAENLPIRTIFAGLPTSHQIIRPFISRFGSECHLELTPIATPYVQQILEDYLSINEPHKLYPTDIAPQTIRQWAESCNGHVLLANQLGYALQQQVIKQLENNPPPAKKDQSHRTILIPKLSQINTRIRNTYYKEQLPTSEQPELQDTFRYIAYASIHNPERSESPEQTPSIYTQTGNLSHPITWEATLDIAHHVAQEYATPATAASEIAAQAHRNLENLQRRGAIRYMEPKPAYLRLHPTSPIPPMEHCEIPIPTITSYIEQQINEMSAAKQQKLRNDIQTIMQEHPFTLATQWQWCNTTERKKLPPIDIPNVKKAQAYEATPARTEPPDRTDDTGQIGPYTFFTVRPHHDIWTVIHADQPDQPQELPYHVLQAKIAAVAAQQDIIYELAPPLSQQVDEWLKQTLNACDPTAVPPLQLDPGEIRVHRHQRHTCIVTAPQVPDAHIQDTNLNQILPAIVRHVQAIRQQQRQQPDSPLYRWGTQSRRTQPQRDGSKTGR